MMLPYYPINGEDRILLAAVERSSAKTLYVFNKSNGLVSLRTDESGFDEEKEYPRMEWGLGLAALEEEGLLKLEAELDGMLRYHITALGQAQYVLEGSWKGIDIAGGPTASGDDTSAGPA